MRRILLVVLLLGLSTSGAARPFTASLLRDINRVAVPGSSSPRLFASLGGVSLLLADDGRTGEELWRTDGTAAGTYPLLDACAGPCPSVLYPLATGGGKAFFIQALPSGRYDLWVTNGLAAGTFRLNSVPLLFANDQRPAAWLAGRGLLLFVAGDSSHGFELWRSNGTPGGTYPVTDLVRGLGSSNPFALTAHQDRGYFFADDGTGLALWRSDGSARGTVKVKAIVFPASSIPAPRILGPAGSYLVYQATTEQKGFELWRTDGTGAGTVPFTDLAPGSNGPYINGFFASGSNALFVATTPADGQELWSTDGTTAGTRRLTSFDLPDALATADATYFLPRPGGGLYFYADDGEHGLELWLSDGTAAGTHMVSDACPGTCGQQPFLGKIYAGRLYFQGTDGTHGTEPWSTNGTAAGTRMVVDLCPGACSSSPSFGPLLSSRLGFSARIGETSQIFATNGTEAGTLNLSLAPPAGDQFYLGLGATTGNFALVAATDPDHGLELWRSNLRRNGTTLVRDINANDLGGSHPSLLTLAGGTAYFFADDGLHGFELWRSDGTAAGTQLVADLIPGLEPERLPFTDFLLGSDSHGRVYFLAPGGDDDTALWVSDGTAAGTTRLSGPGTFLCGGFAALGDRVYFSLEDDARGCQLWSSNGTPSGTSLAAEVGGDIFSNGPQGQVALQGKIYFTVRGQEGAQLWRSDGTQAGTVSLTAGFADSEFGVVSPLVPLGNRLYFLANSAQGVDLWSSDGTAAGTAVAVPLDFPDGRLDLASLAAAGDRLLLSGRLSSGSKLATFVSNGTPAGTVRVAGVERAKSGPVAAFGGRIYFTAGSFTPSDSGLWVSNGTAAGSHLLRSAAGAPIHDATSLSPLGGRLLFLGNTVSGARLTLWQTDGTQAGTKEIPGVAIPTNPTEARLAGTASRLFFTAVDGESGTELWSVIP